MAPSSLDAVLDALESLGLSKNEAKAYLALLRSGPLNGNELAKAAEVPSPKIYAVLERLQRKGLVTPADTTPVTYLPLDPQHLVQMYRSAVNSTLDLLNQTLPEVSGVKHEVYAWQIEGYDRILDRAEQTIRSAAQQVLLLLWDAEAVRLESALQETVNRGVQIISVKFGRSTADIGIVYHHGLAPEVLDVEGRAIVLVADQGQALVANRQDLWRGVWSSNPGLAFLARNYIYHEIYLWKIHGHFGEALYQAFGPHLERLADPTIKTNDHDIRRSNSRPSAPAAPSPP